MPKHYRQKKTTPAVPKNDDRKKLERAHQREKIMVFGTFDVLHPGHIHFFKQARKLVSNPYLIVSVARDMNVKRIKGDLPLRNERQRAAELRKLAIVDKVVLGDARGYLKHIKKEKPNIIALGYDQVDYTEDLERKLKIPIKRLRPFRPHVYKSSILKRRLQ